jgi:hypothetical protein
VLPAAPEPAAGHVHGVHPAGLQLAGGVDRRDPHEQRLVLRPGGADGVDDLEREAHPRLARTAVLVLAPVAQRREELVEQ